MAEPPRYPDTDADPGTPRWVKVGGIIIAIALVFVVVVLHLTGTIGPGAH
jgi:hypothetical protein